MALNKLQQEDIWITVIAFVIVIISLFMIKQLDMAWLFKKIP
ncbi:MAG: hypothetical protein AABY79_07830 [Nitrospirota bacterium]|jgi:hypothetical protein